MSLNLPLKINIVDKKHIIDYNNLKIDLYNILDEIPIFNEDGEINHDDDLFTYRHRDFDYDNLWIIHVDIMFSFLLKNKKVYLTDVKNHTLYELNFDNIKESDKTGWYLVIKENTLVIKDSDYKNNYVGINKILCNNNKMLCNNYKPYCLNVSHIDDNELKNKIKLLNYPSNQPPKIIPDIATTYCTICGLTSFYKIYDNKQLLHGYIKFY